MLALERKLRIHPRSSQRMTTNRAGDCVRRWGIFVGHERRLRTKVARSLPKACLFVHTVYAATRS